MARDKMVTTTPQATVLEVAGLMLAHGIGAVMVVENGALAGIFSQRDVVVRVVAQGRDARAVRVGKVMTPHPVSVDPDVTFGHAMLLMQEHGVRHLPVVENGKPIGMVAARAALDPELEDFVCEVRRRETFR
jgi:CBS domain-containing protein